MPSISRLLCLLRSLLGLALSEAVCQIAEAGFLQVLVVLPQVCSIYQEFVLCRLLRLLLGDSLHQSSLLEILLGMHLTSLLSEFGFGFELMLAILTVRLGL